ncbi:hypothetical protein [Salipiger mucosus]|uniref:hypothetical protein n=1 Tax=Salipiger mucosus TaxID=263378 RepID=UPI0012EBC923|nr:hypothetical protein [Salipiger mucosus]
MIDLPTLASTGLTLQLPCATGAEWTLPKSGAHAFGCPYSGEHPHLRSIPEETASPAFLAIVGTPLWKGETLMLKFLLAAFAGLGIVAERRLEA